MPSERETGGTMKWLLAVVLIGWLTWLTLTPDTSQRRIVQLEMALAQAHAHADTLEAEIESFDRRCGE